MADEENPTNIQLLKRTKIQVFVDEALPDILVVSYEFGVKIFRGVLLDSTKRNLPCGIQTLNPAFKTKPKPDDDILYTVNQRFAYTDPNQTKKRHLPLSSSKYKHNKMTVRLRPRQVLCTKCKGICNENSENVSRKRKSSDNQPTTVLPPVKRGLNAPITRSVYNSELIKKSQEATLVPKLIRLTPQEELSASNSSLNRNSIIIDKLTFKKPLSVNEDLVTSDVTTSSTTTTTTTTINSSISDFGTVIKHSNTNHSIMNSNNHSSADGVSLTTTKTAKRILRKKRSVGSMEDLWDESVFEENKTNQIEQPLSANIITTTNTTRTIKICYGPQGEGTVLKIPAAQIENLNNVIISDDSEENVNINDDTINNDVGGGVNDDDDDDGDNNNKATRKALKKAKREARQRKVVLKSTPQRYLGGSSSGSPRYSIGGSSPRYTIGSASPRHGLLGNNSPRYMCSSHDINILPKKRKHKVKHKKKHREDKDRKHKEGEVSSTQEDPKEQHCITQKLSINLKRLNNTSYTTSIHQSMEKIEDNNTSSSDEHSELVPDFPPPNPPLMLRINSQTIQSTTIADGGRLLVGDVVWGKIHGFPWWPGKVLTITNYNGERPQAHVAWYGSSTSSLMQCDQLSPFLENFKIRYNKKKRGPYKEAIKQATMEAKENAQMRVRQPLGNSPSHNIITQVVPPALASPREIDVAS